MKSAWVVIGSAALAFASYAAGAQAAPPASAGPNTNLARMLDALTLQGKLAPQDAALLTRAALEEGEGPRFALATMPGGRPMCATQALLLTKGWAKSKGVGVLSVPPPSVGFVGSEALPLRVYYQTDDDKGTAEETLKAAEEAWQNQVVLAGYPHPFTGDGKSGAVEPGLWIYLADLDMPGAGAYTEWLDDVEMTPIADCSSRVAIDRSSPLDYVLPTVIHEFNHATQMATDCVESISAWENFTSAVEYHYTGEDWLFNYLVEVFQNNPEYPIDFWYYPDGSDELSYYQYGAALFPVFLNERYGSGGIKMLRDLWYSFAQAGTLNCSPFGCQSDQPNHPNWFEGTEAVLNLQGSSFDEAFDEFSVWRALTGSRDDGKHFKQGAALPGVKLAAEHSLASLPAEGQLQVYEYGSRYIKLSPAGLQGPLRITLRVDPEAAWASSLLLGRKGQPVERIVLPIELGEASLAVASLEGVSWAILVVSQHSDGEHDPDEMEYYTSRSFGYALQTELPEPQPEPLAEAGPVEPDAAPDGSPEPAVASDAPSGDSGCGCAVPGRSAGGYGVLLLLGLAGLARRMRTGSKRRAGSA